MARVLDRSRRSARDGDLVRITYDAEPGVVLEVGDGLKTGTGRTYAIVALRFVERDGWRRYRLTCAVNQEIPGTTHSLVWYKR